MNSNQAGDQGSIPCRANLDSTMVTIPAFIESTEKKNYWNYIEKKKYEEEILRKITWKLRPILYTSARLKKKIWIITEIYELLQKNRMKNMKEKYELLHKRKNDLWRTIRVRFPANLKFGRIMEIHRQK